jgi:hypothetical protein
MLKLVGQLGLVVTLFSAVGLGGCIRSSFHVPGNDEGSEPLNEKEAMEYKKAILRCYKTGGTRVVKIEGNLRCF